eukprot:jgi/Bigna1/68869/fgenesh1_pg.7_\
MAASQGQRDIDLDGGDGRVALIYSPDYVKILDRHPANGNRMTMWEALSASYKLLPCKDRIRLVAPFQASEKDLLEFHEESYVEFVKKNNEVSAASGQFVREAKGAPDRRKLGWEKQGDADEDEEEKEDEEEYDSDPFKEFGLVDDCHVFVGVYDYMRWVAGGTLAAAEELISGRTRIAINWGGGRHHAMPDKASGFCYVNDACLGIMHLNEQFERVLYIDIDVHHGDGVEQAFQYSEEVFTLSFHRYGPSFFPRTGKQMNRFVHVYSPPCMKFFCENDRDVMMMMSSENPREGGGVSKRGKRKANKNGEDDEEGANKGSRVTTSVGQGEGAYRNLNVPLRAGIDDMCYKRIFTKVLQAVLKRFRPTAIVMQCGCDTLAEKMISDDKRRESSPSPSCKNIGVLALLAGSQKESVLKLGIPTLLLGGGGYDPKSVARCWTLLTAAAAQIALNQQIPEHEYSERYAPSFELHTKAHPTRPNANKKVDMAKLSSDIRMYLLKMDRRTIENNLNDNDHDGKRKRRREERKGTISADKNKAARTTEVVITTTTAKSEVAASRIRKLETS